MLMLSSNQHAQVIHYLRVTKFTSNTQTLVTTQGPSRLELDLPRKQMPCLRATLCPVSVSHKEEAIFRTYYSPLSQSTCPSLSYLTLKVADGTKSWAGSPVLKPQWDKNAILSSKPATATTRSYLHLPAVSFGPQNRNQECCYSRW